MPSSSSVERMGMEQVPAILASPLAFAVCGVLVAAAEMYGLPIHAIGVGEQIDDLAPFDPAEFASALVGLDH